MDKSVMKDDGEAAQSSPLGHRHAGKTPDATAAAAPSGRAAVEGEQERRGKQKKPRESLHAWIVHFDAERSSGPPASSDEA